MHLLTRAVLLSLLLGGAPALAEAAPVLVGIPVGLHVSDTTTGPAKTPGKKYVTIEDLELVNPSSAYPQSYETGQFHLLVGDQTYLPAVRPGLGAIDLSNGSILGPGGQTTVTVSFLVPRATTSAKFEFTPHWLDDSGFTVDWCCEYR